MHRSSLGSVKFLFLSLMKTIIKPIFTPSVTFQLDTSKVQELPVIQGSIEHGFFLKNQPTYQPVSQLSFNETILRALQRSPDVSQSVSGFSWTGCLY